MKRIKNNWGEDPRRGWWYEVTVDGHRFAHGEGYDSETTMDTAMDASMTAAREHVCLEEAARVHEETATRAVVIVAARLPVAAALSEAVRKLWELPETTAIVSMVAFGELPADMRVVGVVFAGLDRRAPNLRMWMREMFGHFPMAQVAHIGGVGGPGQDLLS